MDVVTLKKAVKDAGKYTDQEVNNLLNVLNTKAQKGIVSSVSVPLQNGWSGSIVAHKTDTGLVALVGNLNPGTATAATVIATLPVGYRPPDNPDHYHQVVIAAYSGYSLKSHVGLLVGHDGSLLIRMPASDEITSSFSTLVFQVVYYVGV